MTLTRSKRVAEEPLLTLSSTKMMKRRKIAKNDVPVSFVNNMEEDIDTNDVLNTSDHNENEIDVSAEMESIDGGDDELRFEATEVIEETEDTEENPRSSKTKRSKKLEYTLIESFENKNDLDKFWNEEEFGKLFNHHLERASKAGSEDM